MENKNYTLTIGTQPSMPLNNGNKILIFFKDIYLNIGIRILNGPSTGTI